jgi:signal transduction histidine kinase
LINNAFYAVNERLKSNSNSYNPQVTVTTKWLANSVEIRVIDNGNGVPEPIRDKIFQPFFTTKPTGQGTGLGLSLSYDIVKSHGGELSMITHRGQGESGSEFIIKLPIN